MMPAFSEPSAHDEPPGTCSQCGETEPFHGANCPGDPSVSSQQTHVLKRPPAAFPVVSDHDDALARDAQVVLQILPSGVCVMLPLDRPLMFGRSSPDGVEEMLDLTDFNACERGVSRHHCVLQRRGAQLVITDLGSTNGTYLNDILLQPHRDYIVTNGTKLILGSLHLTVIFSDVPA